MAAGRLGLELRGDLLGSFIEKANKATTSRDLFALVESVASSLGFEYVAYGALANCHRIAAGLESPPAVVLNYPLDLQRHYFESGYQDVDPVVTRTARVNRPYIWSAWRANGALEPAEQRVFDEAAEAGLREGVGVPLHGSFGSVAVLSFASSMRRPEGKDLLFWLNVIAAQFHAAYGALMPEPVERGEIPKLTAKQKECLAWVSKGKSSWDIGVILGVSENTVNFHLKQIFKKLDTSNRIVAVIKAIRLGLIEL